MAATRDPNDCVKSSNGEFTSFGLIGPMVTKAFAAGRWPRRQPASCHGFAPAGRLGQDRAMVPPGVTSVTICWRRGRKFTIGYQALVTALNALPTHSSTRSCTMDPRLHEPSYRLLFSFRQGPPVQVLLQGRCFPPIDNGGLQADSARRIVPIIERLLR